MTREEPLITRRTVLRFALAAAALLPGVAHVPAQSTAAAQRAVEEGLSLIDNHDYAASWDAAASPFRNAVTTDKCQEAVRIARTPLGVMKSRTLKSATSTTTLPGAPDGEYVVFQSNAGFERKAAGIETVTAIRERDGVWRVGGYFIK